MSADKLGIPTHVGCIMDGNGRWAARRGRPRYEGHTAGEFAMLEVVDSALELGIKWLTFYAFSTENWDRPPDEVDFLLGFIGDIIDRNGPSFHARNIRMRRMGYRDVRIPAAAIAKIEKYERLTGDNSGLTLTIGLNYGGRTELIDAVNRLVERGRPVSERDMGDSLYFPDMPDPDLIIRFGGEKRLSNFMLWRAAYAELDFQDLLWPDVRQPQFAAAIARYQQRTRKFGALDDP